jgi:AAA+ superfamily predicted ATPase
MAATGYQELFAALGRLDRILERATRAADAAHTGKPSTDPYRGLYISSEDVEKLLAREPGAPLLAGQDTAEKAVEFPRLHHLAERFGLCAFDQDVVLLALAPEVDLRYERLYAYLHDDITRRRPTVDLATQLLCAEREAKLAARARFAPDAPLIRHRVLILQPDPAYAQPPLLAQYLKLDDAIVRYLLGELSVDSRLAGWVDRRQPDEESPVAIPGIPLDRLEMVCRAARTDHQPVRVYFAGPPQTAKRQAAQALAFRLSAPLLYATAARMPSTSPEFEDALDVLFRDAWLDDAVVCVDGFDDLQSGPASRLESFRRHAEKFSGILIVGGEGDTKPRDWDGSTVTFGGLDYAARLSRWREEIRGAHLPQPDTAQLSDLAALHRLNSEQIRSAVSAVAGQTGLQGSEPTGQDLFDAAREQGRRDLGPLAQRVHPVYGWKDLVLPPDRCAQLREIANQARYRHIVLGQWGFDSRLSLGKGLSALFAGPPGTGKTMAAEVIATDLHLDLYKIDLSQIVSKYIGETEKNLSKVFREAAAGSSILFFDEADALFGKRSEVKDAHDRYANIEVAYLLQKIDEYDGLCILATNLRENLDSAFTRRLTFIVDFPFPDEASRKRIWESIWPAATPRSRDLDLGYIATQFKLSGGSVKNVALAAAFLAAVDPSREVRTSHIVHAARREFEKGGRSMTRAELGKFAESEGRV